MAASMIAKCLTTAHGSHTIQVKVLQAANGTAGAVKKIIAVKPYLLPTLVRFHRLFSLKLSDTHGIHLK